jgi:hypothetical protein
VSDETIIHRSKKKMILIIFGSLAFVGIGIWILTWNAADISAGRSYRLFMNSPAFAYTLGVLAIIFFGGLSVFVAKKLFDKNPGLVLNSEGIVDNASIASPGFIPWSEITGISVFEMNKQKTLIVHLTDPKKYADQGNFLLRKLNQANTKFSGSPIYISATTLDIKFDELLDLFDQYLQKYIAN